MNNNKKNLIKLIIAIIFMIVFMFVFMIGMFHGWGYIMETQKAEDIEEITPLCKQRCKTFNMIFYEIVNDGWLYHCWCIDNNKPFKVGTFESN